MHFYGGIFYRCVCPIYGALQPVSPFKYTGLAIPCPIYTITGLKCPGCGVTRMCMALMQLDFDRAFSCHPVLFLLLIPLGIVCMGYAVTYVKDGSIKLKLWQNVILYISIVLLTGYGLVRNI